MRTPVLAALALLFSAAARADDTKPPQISDVRASVKGSQVLVEARITDETGVLSAVLHHRAPGGKVEDTPMVKNDYDDVFRVSFPGGPGTEYWIEASDLLGNGPAAYGPSGKASAVTGSSEGGRVAAAPPPAKKREPAKQEKPSRTAARAPQPPAIQHSAAAAPPEGRGLTVPTKIRSD